MDQNVDVVVVVDEITQSFEVIEKEELENVIDDESNNNNTTSPPAEESTSSDNNNNGNKKYTRDELIKLKQTMADAAPELKDAVKGFIFKKTALDNTLDRSRPIPRGDAVDKMMPAYAMPNNRNSYQKQRSGDYTSGRRSAQGNRSNSSSLIKVNLQSNEDVKLNESKNAWKPQMLNTDVDTPEEERKTAELLKQFRSILNKITPENFSTLIEHLKTLNIDNIDILDSCISLVFEKAILEPNFGASYAQLCKEVSDVFVVPLDESNKEQKAVFKKRLITQCQKEFEKHRDNELVKNNTERLKEIDDEEDAEKREELKSNYEMESYKIRRRAVGTVHFIGELYKIEMLTSRIMQSCISHLLDPSMCSEETLECLCKLLTTIGKRLEKLDAKKIDLSDCFATLAKLADKKNPIGISSRIRFMIQDLIELRLNHWTPRKLQQVVKPMSMEEIKQQAAMEQYLKMETTRERDGDRGQNNRSGFYQGGGSGNNKRGNIVNEDGWSTQYSKSRPLKLDMNKIQILPASDDIVLGGVPSFQNFGNRFSGLKEDESVADQTANRPYGGRFSGGGNSMNQNRNSSNNNNSFDRNNRGGNRNNNNFNNNNSNNRSAGSRSLQPPMMGSGQGQKQFGPSRKTSYQPMQRPDLPMKSNTLPRKISAPARPMTDRVIQERDLVANPDQVSDALQKFVKAYGSDEMTMNDVVEKLRKFRITREPLVAIYNWVFDQHDKERFHIAEIVCECVSRNLIMTSDLLEALQEIVEIAQDLACDLPHVYAYIGQLLALPLLKRIVQFKDLLAMSKMEIEANNGAAVLKNVLKVFEQKYEKQALTQLYNEAGIDFQLFLDSDTKLGNFLQENNFEYLTKPEAKPEPLVPLDENTRQKLQEMLKNPNNDVDTIIVWIQNTINNPADKGFIRSLTEVILAECIEKTLEGYQLNKPKLERLAPLLAQFFDMKPEREVQGMHTIKRIVVELEHPSNCLHEILTSLYDNFALSKDGFLMWRDDNDPLEQEGKGVALKSCTAFIQFLKEEKDEESTGEDEN